MGLVKALTKDTIYQVWRIKNEQKWGSTLQRYSTLLEAIFGAMELIFSER